MCMRGTGLPEPPPQTGMALITPGAPCTTTHRGVQFLSPKREDASNQSGKRDVAVVAAQTTVTYLIPLPPPEEETAIGTSPTTNTLTPDTKEQQHTYVRGSIEGTEVNILVDSGATESFRLALHVQRHSAVV